MPPCFPRSPPLGLENIVDNEMKDDLGKFFLIFSTLQMKKNLQLNSR